MQIIVAQAANGFVFGYHTILGFCVHVDLDTAGLISILEERLLVFCSLWLMSLHLFA